MMDDDGDMQKHLQIVKQLKHQIEEQGEKISVSSYVSMLLNCTPTRYDVQISILEAQDDIMLVIIINRLLEKYRKFLATKNKKSMMAMLTDHGKGKREKNSKKNNNKFNSKYNYCNKREYKKNQC